MLDPIKHKDMLVRILQSIYKDPEIRTILGFKGGTAAMLYYNLPRLSVDLDFDLLDETKKAVVMAKMPSVLERHGELRDATEKRFTLFFLMSYKKGQHMIKLDISKRVGASRFELKNFMGITALVMREEDALANKLAALLTRRVFAMRDVYDVWYFLESHFRANETVLEEKTDLALAPALKQAIKLVSDIKTNQLLRGLGELLDEKQKAWAKEHLVEETVFQLRLYLDEVERQTKEVAQAG